MEEFVKELGFESEKEFHDLTNPKIMKMYLDWKYNDGTKEGLIKVIEASQVK